MPMTKHNVTLPMLTAALALLLCMPAQAQVYEGVVADDQGSISDEMQSVYNYAPGETPSDVYKSDYYKQQAEKKKANRESYRKQAEAERAQAAQARKAEAQAAQAAIDARVEAAVSAPNDYATRIDGLKAPPPQMPDTQPPQQQPPSQPAVQPAPAGTPGTGSSGSGGDRGGSVLERMMNALQ